MICKLNKEKVTNKIYESFYVVNKVQYGGVNYWIRKKESRNDTIYFYHYTYDFYRDKIVMYIPFKYDNYKIITKYAVKPFL